MKGKITKKDVGKLWFIEDGFTEEKEYGLADWVKLEYIEIGKANLEIKEGKVTFCTMKDKIQKKPAEPNGDKPTKDKKWEDDIVTFETLLTKAHSLKAPFSIKTEMLQLDVEKKFSLFKARVVVNKQLGEQYMRVFEGHGDATKENVTGEFIKPHFIRMAETRAIVRALRWYTNNGCAEEEK